MKTTDRRKPEILAPAGTYEAMEAAVKAGCDAVYAGGSLFSARAYAGNFDEASFLKALDFCHLFDVKVYMTLNTLLKEGEISSSGEALARYLKPYYEAGLDAVLVQDMGVLKVLKEQFPDLPVHASTQMSISSAFGARLAKKLGMERIVPARELSLKEIRAIRESEEIEIETFVHGAMCFAYSGKCLLSSFAGGRSGNRGRCAQPCRKCYHLYEDPESSKTAVQEYLLSLKDLCALKDLPLLIDAGIDSFKIEGRMKNPSYVASAVFAYRRARDSYLELKEGGQAEDFAHLSEDARKRYLHLAKDLQLELADIYNRGGFYGGYYFTDKGKVMSALKRPNHQGLRIGTVVSVKAPKIQIRLEEDLHKSDVVEIREAGVEEMPGIPEAGIELTCGTEGAAKETVWLNGKNLSKIHPGMEVFRTRNEALLNRIQREILEPEKTISASCRVRARVGEPLTILLRAEDQKEETEVVLKGDPVERAGKAPTSEETIREKLQKSGGSLVRIVQTECELDPDVFIRMSAFNFLRREAAEKLKEKIITRRHRKRPGADVSF